MRRHPDVKDAVTILHIDDQGEKRLVSFVIPSPTAASAIRPAQLRNFLASLLPSYMVPSAVQIVPTFPLTTATKVDRKALARSYVPSQEVEDEEHYEAPTGWIEETISNIFQTALSRPRMSALDE